MVLLDTRDFTHVKGRCQVVSFVDLTSLCTFTSEAGVFHYIFTALGITTVTLTSSFVFEHFFLHPLLLTCSVKINTYFELSV